MNTNGGEQHGDEEPQQQLLNAQRQKRQRDDLEDTTDEEVSLNIAPLTSDGSAASLFSCDSQVTVKNTDQGAKGPREYQPPNRSPILIQNADDRERLMIVKLERLRDKEDRYSSHIAFLKERHQAKEVY